MLKTTPELLAEIGAAIRAQRLHQGWTQTEAAARAGMGLRTWRRLETHGQATLEALVNAAVALRCEEGLEKLFPTPAAGSMDELLKRQAVVAPKSRQRAAPRRASSRRAS